MHGRLKVKTTEEQQEAKRKEREKKLQLYKGATQQIFSKRENGIHDEESLKLSGQVLIVNSDFSTLWNIRKEIFTHFKETRDLEEVDKLFQDELHFLEACLKSNPKSYGTWHHRCFVMENMSIPDWKHELELCNKFLEYDERNFHCWDYRRFVVKKSNVSPEDELKFTTDKISSNFSNYSSWHYRSKLLPIVYPDFTQPVGVREDILLQEYETVQNAFFTDPDDQSSWFYHRWLLGRGNQRLTICSIHVSTTQGRIIIHLSKEINKKQAAMFRVHINGKLCASVLVKNPVTCYHSSLWKLDLEFIPDTKSCIKVGLSRCEMMSINLNENGEGVNHRPCAQSPVKKFSSETSAATNDTLSRELSSIQELIELEPENKWAILTAVSLMRAIDTVKYDTQVMEYLDKLIEIDTKRTMYYKDMKSRFFIENAIDEDIHHQKTIDLSDSNLTQLYHSDYFFAVKSVNLSNNALSGCDKLAYLQCVEKLNLDNNKLTSLSGLSKLPDIQDLSIAGNNIQTMETLEQLKGCKSLRSLTLKGNPVCGNIDLEKELKKLIPQIQTLDCR